MSTDPNTQAEVWGDKPLAALIEDIVQTHHVYCREEVPRLELLFQEVIGKHGKEHPELKRIHDLFLQMSRDLSMHLLKEEQTLFPYITKVEAEVVQGDLVSWPPFGTVENPIRIMVLEHGKATGEIEEIREISGNYVPPADGDGSYTALYAGLEAFDHDMQQHIDREDNLLFPRAAAMEQEACARQSATRQQP